MSVSRQISLRAGLGALLLAALPALPAWSQSDSDVFDQEGAALFDALVGQQLRQMAQQITSQSQLQNRLNNQIVAEVDFKDASLQQVVDFIQTRSKELDKEQRPLNIIVTKAARDATQGQTTNLKLTNVPLGVVLNYASQQLGVAPRVEQYAIVIDVPQRVGQPAAQGQPAVPVR